MSCLRMVGFVLLAISAQAADLRSKADVTPLQKLIQMLDEMIGKGKAEKHTEEVEFAKFHEWCDGVKAEKTKSIAQAAAQIEQLKADIQKALSDAEVLGQEIEELEAKIAKAEDELEGATGVREKEHADYSGEAKDLSESIDACKRAVEVLKARSEDVPQSLAQVQGSRLVPAYARAVINSFLSLHISTSLETGAPEANAYEFQSGGVVSLLEKLEAQFKEQLLAVEKEEIAAKANYKLLEQQLTDDIEHDKKTVSKKTQTKAAKQEAAAIAKGDLETTTVTKADDEKVLADTNAECVARSDEFEKNQVTRAEEIKAIETAVEILSSDSVKGNADTYLPTLIQVRSTSLVQSQGEMTWNPMTRRKAVKFLQSRAQQLGSRTLALAADRAAADPFVKVKKMIKDLIVKLMEEANSEADAHAFCTTELATNKLTRENKAAEVEDLSAHIEKNTAESARLLAEIQELTDAIAKIKASQSEATKLREEEKKTNAQTVADAKEAEVAVEKAIKVLKEFYAKAAEAAFLQGAQGDSAAVQIRTEMAAAEKAPYKGMQAASGGIFGMLEVVLSDFARLEAETLAAEETAATTYEKFMNESNESVAVKETEVEHKTSKKALLDEETEGLKKDLSLTQAELDKAMDYYDKLKAQCVDNGLSYEDRVKAREEEMQSLKEALAILEQQDLA